MSSTLPGTHWTALFKQSKNNVFYFDSFGCPPPQVVVDNFPTVISNCYSIQSMQSSACGFYAVLFLFHMKSKATPQHFTDFFSYFTPFARKNESILYYIFSFLLSKLSEH